MGLMNPFRDMSHRGRPNLKVQKYTAIVVDDDDPEKLQRIKARVPHMHRNVKDKQLPWIMRQNGHQTNAKDGVGHVQVPPKGSKVYVHMEEDDPHNGYYSGTPPTKDVMKDHELTQKEADYPHSYGQVDQAGNKTQTNTSTNQVVYTHKSGATISIAGDGKMSFYSPTGFDFGTKGTFTMKARKDVKFHTKKKMSVKGQKRVDINGKDKLAQLSEVKERKRPNIPSPAGKTKL